MEISEEEIKGLKSRLSVLERALRQNQMHEQPGCEQEAAGSHPGEPPSETAEPRRERLAHLELCCERIGNILQRLECTLGGLEAAFPGLSAQKKSKSKKHKAKLTSKLAENTLQHDSDKSGTGSPPNNQLEILKTGSDCPATLEDDSKQIKEHNKGKSSKQTMTYVVKLPGPECSVGSLSILSQGSLSLQRLESALGVVEAAYPGLLAQTKSKSQKHMAKLAFKLARNILQHDRDKSVTGSPPNNQLGILQTGSDCPATMEDDSKQIREHDKGKSSKPTMGANQSASREDAGEEQETKGRIVTKEHTGEDSPRNVLEPEKECVPKQTGPQKMDDNDQLCTIKSSKREVACNVEQKEDVVTGALASGSNDASIDEYPDEGTPFEEPISVDSETGVVNSSTTGDKQTTTNVAHDQVPKASPRIDDVAKSDRPRVHFASTLPSRNDRVPRTVRVPVCPVDCESELFFSDWLSRDSPWVEGTEFLAEIPLIPTKISATDPESDFGCADARLRGLQNACMGMRNLTKQIVEEEPRSAQAVQESTSRPQKRTQGKRNTTDGPSHKPAKLLRSSRSRTKQATKDDANLKARSPHQSRSVGADATRETRNSQERSKDRKPTVTDSRPHTSSEHSARRSSKPDLSKDASQTSVPAEEKVSRFTVSESRPETCVWEERNASKAVPDQKRTREATRGNQRRCERTTKPTLTDMRVGFAAESHGPSGELANPAMEDAKPLTLYVVSSRARLSDGENEDSGAGSEASDEADPSLAEKATLAEVDLARRPALEKTGQHTVLPLPVDKSDSSGLLRELLRLGVLRGMWDLVAEMAGAGADLRTKDLAGRTALHCAAAAGQLGAVSRLLAAGADRTTQDSDGKTALHHAAERGNAQVLAPLLADGAEVDSADNAGQTCLLLAVASENPEAVRAILDAGADPCKVTDGNQSPLYVAVRNGLTDIVKMLVDAGANVKEKNAKNETVLHLAAQAKNGEVVTMLLGAGADPMARDFEGQTALHIAATNGDLDSVSALINAGTMKDARDCKGHCPIHRAARAKQAEAVARMLECGVSPETEDRKGKSALHHAAKADSVSVIQALVAGKADINKRDCDKRAPLHIAARRNNMAALKALLENGASLEAEASRGESVLHSAAMCNSVDALKYLATKIHLSTRDKEGKTALHAAADEGNLEAVWVLLDSGADPNAVDWYGNSSIHFAAECGRKECLRALMSGARHFSMKGFEGTTPLHFAAGRGQVECLALLIERGADIEEISDFGQTPLHVACGRGHVECVEELLEAGADIGAACNEGNTPLHYAVMEHREDVISRLLSAGADPDVKNGEGASSRDLAENEELEHLFGDGVEDGDGGGGSGDGLSDEETEDGGVDGKDVRQTAGKTCPPLTNNMEDALGDIQDLKARLAAVESEVQAGIAQHRPPCNQLVGARSLVRGMFRENSDNDKFYNLERSCFNIGTMLENIGGRLARLEGHLCRFRMDRRPRKKTIVAPTAAKQPTRTASAPDPTDLTTHEPTPSEKDDPETWIATQKDHKPAQGTPRKTDICYKEKTTSVCPTTTTQRCYTPIVEAIYKNMHIILENCGPQLSKQCAGRRVWEAAVSGGGREWNAAQHGDCADSQARDTKIENRSRDVPAVLEEATSNRNLRICGRTAASEQSLWDAAQTAWPKRASALHRAARSGDADAVRARLADGADPNARDGAGRTALYAAAAAGSSEVVKLLLSAGADPAAVTERGENALHAAARGGHEIVASTLMSAGVFVNDRDGAGNTALHLAALSGNAELVNWLLASGADPTAQAADGQTPLHAAAGRGAAEIVSALLEGGASAQARCSLGLQPIHRAALAGQAEAIRRLVEAGVDPDEQDQHGLRPLHHAALVNSVAAVEALLAKKAGIDKRNLSEHTAMYVAAVNDSTDALKVLLKRGASLFSECTRGLTQMNFYESSQGCGAPKTQFVGNEQSERFIYEETAAHAVVRNGNAEALRLMLDAGVCPGVADDHGDSLMHLAAALGKTECLKVLLCKASAKRKNNVIQHVERRNKRGETPLHLAVGRGHGECIGLLVKARAGAGALCERGNAATERRERAMEMLVRACAGSASLGHLAGELGPGECASE